MRADSISIENSLPPQTEARYWKATLARDGRADGAFFFAVRSTQIYCRPSCPARRPLRTNTLFFKTPREAEKEGFRPWRRCKPDQISAAVRIVERAAQVMESEVEEPVRAGALVKT